MATAPLPVHLADISHHQSRVDLRKAKDAGLFAIVHKCTQGLRYVDPRFDERHADAHKIGLTFGAYHFAETSDPVGQAKHFLKHADIKPGDYRPMLDLEDTNGSRFSAMNIKARTEWVRQFVDVVFKATGVKPFIYTPFDLLDTFDCPLWVARYSNTNAMPHVPAPWKTFTVRQFTNGIYGVPKSFPGLGNVDLNCYNGDPARLTRTFTIPKPPVVAPPKPPKPAAKKSLRLRIAVAPMQFSDNDKETAADLEKIFSRGYDAVLGTESGPGSNTIPLLEAAAKKHGYYLSQNSRYDTWVAVEESLLKKGTWKEGAEHAIDRSSRQPKEHVSGHWGDKATVWGQGEIPGYGKVTFGSCHPLTWGGTSDWLKNKTDDDQAVVNGKLIKEHGAGSGLVFVGGDFNRPDKKFDLDRGKFEGESCWDALKTWPNTGHGNIDAVLRSTADRRTKWVSATALDDTELFLNTDHFLTETVVEIAPL